MKRFWDWLKRVWLGADGMIEKKERQLDAVDLALLRGAEANEAISPSVILDEMEKAIANMRTKDYGEFGYPTLMADLYGCVVSPGFRRVWTAPIAELKDA